MQHPPVVSDYLFFSSFSLIIQVNSVYLLLTQQSADLKVYFSPSFSFNSLQISYALYSILME